MNKLLAVFSVSLAFTVSACDETDILCFPMGYWPTYVGKGSVSVPMPKVTETDPKKFDWYVCEGVIAPTPGGMCKMKPSLACVPKSLPASWPSSANWFAADQFMKAYPCTEHVTCYPYKDGVPNIGPAKMPPGMGPTEDLPVPPEWQKPDHQMEAMLVPVAY